MNISSQDKDINIFQTRWSNSDGVIIIYYVSECKLIATGISFINNT